MQHYTMLINGVQVAGENGQFDVINPATGTAFAQCPAGSLAQLDAAVDAAQAAFKTWRLSTHALRCERLMAIADDIEQNADALARLIVLEQGKPLELAFSEVMGAPPGPATPPGNRSTSSWWKKPRPSASSCTASPWGWWPPSHRGTGRS